MTAWRRDGTAAWLSAIGTLLAVVVAAVGLLRASGSEETSARAAPEIAPQATSDGEDANELQLSITSLSQRVSRFEARFEADGVVDGLDDGWVVFLIASPDDADASDAGWLASLPAKIRDGRWSASLSVEPPKGEYVVRAIAAPMTGTEDCPPGATCGAASPSCPPSTKPSDCGGGSYVHAEPLTLSELFDPTAETSASEVVQLGEPRANAATP